MILGVGTDMASIDRISTVLGRHGDRFKQRCFAKEERERVENSAADAQAAAGGYAKRWAAKEACAKALGLGIRENIYLRDIVVLNDENGKPRLELRGGAKERLTSLTPKGMNSRIHLSLSDEFPMAIAFVVISAVTGDNDDGVEKWMPR